MTDEQNPVPGTAPEEEIPQNEDDLLSEEEHSEGSDEEEMDPDKKALFKELGIGEDVKEENVTDKVKDDDEDKNLSKGVQKRINDMRRKQGDAERAAEAAKKEADELKAKLARYESEQPPAPATKEEPAGPTEKDQSDLKVAELKAQIAEKRKELRTAKEEFDYDKEFELDDQIEELKEKIREERSKANKPAVDYSEQAAKAAFEQSLKIATQEFAAKNSWFKQFDKDGNPNTAYDHIKSTAAVRISNDLEKTFDGTPHEFFKELERRVALEFPDKTKQRIPHVASATTVRDMQKSKKEINTDEKTSRMLAGIFGDDTENINRVITNVQSRGAN